MPDAASLAASLFARYVATPPALLILPRLGGFQVLDTNKQQCSSNFVCIKHSPSLLQREATASQVVQAVAHVVAGIAVETKKGNGHGLGVPMTKEAKKKMKWEKMMKEIAVSGSAVAVLRSHREAGKLSKQTILGTLIRLRQLNLWARVIEVLEWLREQKWWKFGLEDHNLLIAAYGKLGQPEKASSVLEKMRDAGLEPNVAVHTSLLEAYARNGLFDQAESIFSRMLETGPAPTEATYQTFIHALSKGGRYEDAERIFKGMSDRDEVKPDVRHFNLMVHTYGKAGKMTEAQALLRQMKGLGLPLSAVSFNSIMSLQTSVADAEAVLRQMQLANIQPDVITYTGLIKAYSKSRRVEEAQAVFREMVASGIRPTRTTYNTLLDAYAKCKEIVGAESVFKKMGQDRCRPDAHSYSTLMAAYVNVGDIHKAEQVLDRMKKAGLEPNVVTYGTLMLGYTSVHDTSSLLRTYEDLRKAGIQPNQTIYTLLVRSFGQEDDFEAALSWFKEMTASGCRVDQRSRSALMDACQTIEQKQEALDYLGSITEASM